MRDSTKSRRSYRVGRRNLDLAEALELQLLASAALVMWLDALLNIDRLREWRSRLRQVDDVAREAASEPTPLSTVGGSHRVEPATALLDCRDISFDASDGASVLKGITFSARPGDRIAIVGGGGSGKTLLAQVLLGVRQASGGAAIVDGVDVRVLPMANRRTLIAGLLDDGRPIGPTIRGFLRSATHATDRELHRALRAVGLEQWISALPLGLRTPIVRGGTGFASHERRLLCVARLIVLAPRIAVVDGLVDGLDVQRASTAVAALGERADVVVLLTARPEIVPQTYRLYSLVAGSLS